MYDYSVLLLDTLLNKSKPFNKQKQSSCVRDKTKKLASIISIEVSYCPLDCLKHFYQWSLVIGPYENMGKRFFSRWGYTLHFCYPNPMITENLSNSAAQFLLVGACGCAHCISCFQDDLSILKAFTLKVFKCPNKKVFFFNWVTGISIKFFCSFTEANQANLPYRAPS